MKKLLVAILAVTLLSAPVMAEKGGKKKARKRAKTECTIKCTDIKDCKKGAKCCPPCDPCPPEACSYIKRVI